MDGPGYQNTMIWDVITTKDHHSWNASLRKLPQNDIYFSVEYHNAYELNGDGQAMAFVVQQGEDLLFHPFLVRPINRVSGIELCHTLYDIETVYGYSGPISTTTSSNFLCEAWRIFSKWCVDNSIIAEFIRFHPLIGNHIYAGPDCDVTMDRETVVVDLNCNEDQLWSGYSSVHRNMVRKALKNGLICTDEAPDEGLNSLKIIYRQTMERVGATNYYYFSDGYFDNLASSLIEKIKVFTVRSGDEVIASGLFFVEGDFMHYHLAGSKEAFMSQAPNNLLLHTAALWGLSSGCSWLHLGGGRTNLDDDGLLHFKSSVSSSRSEFFTGKRIHDPSSYQDLCSKWVNQNQPETNPSYFLLYRLS